LSFKEQIGDSSPQAKQDQYDHEISEMETSNESLEGEIRLYQGLVIFLMAVLIGMTYINS